MKDTKLRNALKQSGLIDISPWYGFISSNLYVGGLKHENLVLRKQVDNLEHKLASLALTLGLEWMPALQAPPRWEKRKATFDPGFGPG